MRKLMGAIGVLAALIYGVALFGLGAAYDSHGGDFTWRTQTVIDWLQTPVFTAVTLVFLLAAREMYCARAKASRGLWWTVFGFSLATAAMWWAFVFPLESRIMSWTANWPPTDWNDVGKLHAFWCGVGILLGLLTSVGLLFVLEKDRRA